MKLKKLSCLFLILSMVMSLMACGEDKSDKDNESKKEETKQEQEKEISVETVVENISKNTFLSSDSIEEITKDKFITYDEFQTVLESLPSVKEEVGFSFVGSMEAEAEGESESQDISVNGTMLYEFDSQSKNLHISTTYYMNTEKSTVDYYLINEDGTYYQYEQCDGEVATRTELGSIKDLFGEDGLSLEDISDEMGLASSVNVFSSYASYYKDLMENFTLDKEMAEYKNNKYYKLLFDFDAMSVINTLKNEDIIKDALKEYGYENIDDLLKTELVEGKTTVKDFVDLVKFDIEYYVDPVKYYVAHTSVDATEQVQKLFDLFKDYLLFNYESMGISDVTIELKCTEATYTVDLDMDADVSVKFDGEYEDFNPEAFYDWDSFDDENTDIDWID